MKIRNIKGLNPSIKETIYHGERDCLFEITEKTHTKIAKTDTRIVPILESVKNRRVFGIQVSSATTTDKANVKYFFIFITSSKDISLIIIQHFLQNANYYTIKTMFFRSYN